MTWRHCSQWAGLIGAALLAVQTLSIHAKSSDTANGEWRHYSGDNGATKYSPVDQINKDNVGKLRVAWRHAQFGPELQAANPQLRLSNNFRSTPIMVGGVLYASNGVGLAEAIDPATGKTIWTQDPGPDGLRGAGSNRGVAYWGEGADARIITFRGRYLY